MPGAVTAKSPATVGLQIMTEGGAAGFSRSLYTAAANRRQPRWAAATVAGSDPGASCRRPSVDPPVEVIGGVFPNHIAKQLIDDGVQEDRFHGGPDADCAVVLARGQGGLSDPRELAVHARPTAKVVKHAPQPGLRPRLSQLAQ